MAKTKSARTPEPTACPPGWAWLLAGVLIGVFISFLYYVTQIVPQHPDTIAHHAEPPQMITEQPLPAESTHGLSGLSQIPARLPDQTATSELAVANVPPPAEPDFDFYEELPNNEIANDTAVASPAETVVTAMPVTPIPVTSEPPPAERPTTNQAYLLQVGSFREYQQAEGLKAHLALLGIASQVQQVNLNGVVWNRVQVGPFNDLTHVSQMQQRLAAEQISSLVLNP